MRRRLVGFVPGDPAVLARIVANPANFYVNVHNARFPGGCAALPAGGLARRADDEVTGRPERAAPSLDPQAVRCLQIRPLAPFALLVVGHRILDRNEVRPLRDRHVPPAATFRSGHERVGLHVDDDGPRWESAFASTSAARSSPIPSTRIARAPRLAAFAARSTGSVSPWSRPDSSR